MTRLLYIIASTMDGIGLEIETFYDPAKCLKRMSALVDAPFPKPRPEQTPQEYHAAYTEWVQEERDNVCENDIALLVEEIDMVSHEQLVGRAIRQPAEPAVPPADLKHLDLSEDDKHILNALNVWRTQRANDENVTIGTILVDDVLLAIAQAKPRTFQDLLQVKGIGPAKCRKLGDDIIAILNAFI